MTDNKHAELIASGIAALQIAASGQNIPEGGLSFDPQDSRLEGEIKLRVVPLNGPDAYDLTVIASQQTGLQNAVQAGLEALAAPEAPHSSEPLQKPKPD